MKWFINALSLFAAITLLAQQSTPSKEQIEEFKKQGSRQLKRAFIYEI